MRAKLMLVLDTLSITYRARGATVHAVTDVSLSLAAGQTLGLVGESGCGKTTLALAILGLLPPTATVSGQIRFDGVDLLGLGERERRARRWREIAYVPQSAINSLVPVTDLRAQFREVWRAHGMAAAELGPRAAELMRRVELDPALLDRYPHELSGGMRQRAIIALALLLGPKLLVADEPTTGLDVIVQRQVLNLLRALRASESMSLVFISHDIGVVAELCDSVAVLYAGEVMETGPTAAVLAEPLHPYSMGLEQAFPDIRAPQRPLASIPGAPPRLAEPIPACAFAPRCPFARDLCRTEKPRLQEWGRGRAAACHFAGDAAALREAARRPQTWEGVLAA